MSEWRVKPGSDLAIQLDGFEPGDEDRLDDAWASDFEKVEPPLREEVEKALGAISEEMRWAVCCLDHESHGLDDCPRNGWERIQEAREKHFSTLRAALASRDAETVWSAFESLIEKLEESLDGEPWSDAKVRRHIELIRARAHYALAPPRESSLSDEVTCDGCEKNTEEFGCFCLECQAALGSADAIEFLKLQGRTVPPPASGVLVDRIVDGLFTNFAGDHGDRLVMVDSEGRDLGGWSADAVRSRIRALLAEPKGGSDE